MFYRSQQIATTERARAEQQRIVAEVQSDAAKAASREAERQRDLAVFAVDAAKRIAGPVSGQLLRLAETAEAAINSSSPIDRERAYLKFADYYRVTNDPELAKKTLEQEEKHIDQAKPSASDPKFRWIQIENAEIHGDIARGDTRNRDSARYYQLALNILNTFDAADADVAPARARLSRKIIDFGQLRGDIKSAEEHLIAGELLLAGQTQSWAVHEAALLAVSHAGLLLHLGKLEDASSQFARAVQLFRKAGAVHPNDKRWSRFPGQNGGLAKMDSGFGYAASFSSFACVA
jgi:tetratricopeptide (TPR) repeat protein